MQLDARIIHSLVGVDEVLQHILHRFVDELFGLIQKAVGDGQRI